MDVCGANHLDPAMRHHSRATHAEAHVRHRHRGRGLGGRRPRRPPQLRPDALRPAARGRPGEGPRRLPGLVYLTEEVRDPRQPQDLGWRARRSGPVRRAAHRRSRHRRRRRDPRAAAAQGAYAWTRRPADARSRAMTSPPCWPACCTTSAPRIVCSTSTAEISRSTTRSKLCCPAEPIGDLRSIALAPRAWRHSIRLVNWFMSK